MAQLFCAWFAVRRGLKNWPVVVLAVTQAACRTLPVDGDAVECDRCGAMWIRLYADTPAPGLYRLDDEQRTGRGACARCEQLSVQYFESAALRRKCPDCDGKLAPRAVNIIR